VVNAWRNLPQPIIAAIVALVRAANALPRE
jgi:hypothetical protein